MHSAAVGMRNRAIFGAAACPVNQRAVRFCASGLLRPIGAASCATGSYERPCRRLSSAAPQRGINGNPRSFRCRRGGSSDRAVRSADQEPAEPAFGQVCETAGACRRSRPSGGRPSPGIGSARRRAPRTDQAVVRRPQSMQSTTGRARGCRHRRVRRRCSALRPARSRAHAPHPRSCVRGTGRSQRAAPCARHTDRPGTSSCSSLSAGAMPARLTLIQASRGRHRRRSGQDAGHTACDSGAPAIGVDGEHRVHPGQAEHLWRPSASARPVPAARRRQDCFIAATTAPSPRAVEEIRPAPGRAPPAPRAGRSVRASGP